MKNILLIPLVLLLLASTGWCISIKDTDAGVLDGTLVGYIDTFLAGTDTLSNNKPETQTNWVNDALIDLGIIKTATFQVRDEPVEYFLTDETDVFAFKMELPASEYYLIKNTNAVALFLNLDEMLWGVFAAIPDMNLTSGNFEISHVTRFNPAPVPEPSTVLLLGSGLLGLAWYGRKRKKA